MVNWTTPAKDDLRNIHDYIAKDSKYYAKKVSADIIYRSARIESFPKMGRIVPEINDSNIRELFLYSYRLIYEILPSGIQVLTLIHSKQNFNGNLDKLGARE